MNSAREPEPETAVVGIRRREVRIENGNRSLLLAAEVFRSRSRPRIELSGGSAVSDGDEAAAPP
jgi:hypothetical protein